MLGTATRRSDAPSRSATGSSRTRASCPSSTGSATTLTGSGRRGGEVQPTQPGPAPLPGPEGWAAVSADAGARPAPDAPAEAAVSASARGGPVGAHSGLARTSPTRTPALVPPAHADKGHVRDRSPRQSQPRSRTHAGLTNRMHGLWSDLERHE